MFGDGAWTENWISFLFVCVKKKSLWRLLNEEIVYSRDLDLKKPIYQRTAAYGHFGRDSFPWEVPKKLKY
ncbi:METK2 synthase, partial [Atractosteus spatula]|nr:METK2 synthase [Atractosteus spatula]